MFRRLFAIETEALRTNADDLTLRQEHADYPATENMRELARFAATPSRFGPWACRAAI